MCNRLLEIKKELRKYHRDRQFLEKYYINKRLHDSLISYYSDLEDSIKYLNNRQSENIFKKFGE